MEERWSFPTNGDGWSQGTTTCKKTNLHPTQKLTLNWIRDLHVRCKTKKLPENNIGEYLDDLGFGSDFLNTIPNTQSMEESIDKMDFINNKQSCSLRHCQDNNNTSHTLGEYIY